jgi:hypothetical protein
VPDSRDPVDREVDHVASKRLRLNGERGAVVEVRQPEVTDGAVAHLGAELRRGPIDKQLVLTKQLADHGGDFIAVSGVEKHAAGQAGHCSSDGKGASGLGLHDTNLRQSGIASYFPEYTSSVARHARTPAFESPANVDRSGTRCGMWPRPVRNAARSPARRFLA